MRTEIQKFEYEKQLIRTKVDEEEQIWFVGIDICNILGYADSYQTIMKRLDEDERKLDRLQDGQGKQKDTLTVSECGFYSLALTSTKPEAKAFKRWVTHDVLPMIRKAGLYTTEEAQNKEFELQRVTTEAEKLENEITDLKSRLKTLTVEKDKKFIELRQIIRSNPNQLKLELKEEPEKK